MYRVCYMFRPTYRSSSGVFPKTQTNFLELGCSNVDPYYAVGCFYLANITSENVNNFVCKVLMLQNCYKWLGINKTYYLLTECVLRIDINVKSEIKRKNEFVIYSHVELNVLVLSRFLYKNDHVEYSCLWPVSVLRLQDKVRNPHPDALPPHPQVWLSYPVNTKEAEWLYLTPWFIETGSVQNI
jgi:hypothetical protein